MKNRKNLPREPLAGAPPDVPAPDAPLLEAKALAFSYGEPGSPLLRQVGFQLARGEVVALLGRSGSGKSTLLNLLAGIDRPGGGELVIDGREMTALDERARTLFRRRHIGFVYQFFNLVDSLTAVENVALPLELNGKSHTAALASARESLAMVGLYDRARHLPDQLSGGEQQRVAIARALVHRPALVLADEPTGNLDAATGREMLALLHSLVAERGSAMVLVTHSSEVAASADRVLVLEEGRLRREDGA